MKPGILQNEGHDSAAEQETEDPEHSSELEQAEEEAEETIEGVALGLVQVGMGEESEMDMEIGDVAHHDPLY